MDINKDTMLAIIRELFRVTSKSYYRTQDSADYLEGACDAYEGLIKMLERIDANGHNQLHLNHDKH